MECQTFTIEKNWRYQNFDFLGKKIWRNARTLKSKKVEGIFEERLYWDYRLQLSFVHKIMSQISFKLFFSEDKRFLS